MQKTNKYLRGVLTSFGFFALVLLSACVPSALQTHTTLFFSSQAWGNSPFSSVEKKGVFTEALKSKALKRSVKPVPFLIEEQGVYVERFVAIYEVDARQSPPVLKNGYILALNPGIEPPKAITLTNTLTGVSWSVTLEKALAGG